MKKCSQCGEFNSDDFIICAKCGKLLNKRLIKSENHIKFFVFTVIIVTFIFIGTKIYDKLAYKTLIIRDYEFTRDIVASYKIPSNWYYSENIIYNPKSIPNLLRYYVIVKDKRNSNEFLFFSTQYESSGNIVLEREEEVINPEEYFINIIKNIYPNAKNIKLVSKRRARTKEKKEMKESQELFEIIYNETNPPTPKCKSGIEYEVAEPIHYLFSYEDNGQRYYQQFDGRIISFTQNFSKEITRQRNMNIKIRYIKCEDIFSYRAKVKEYRKNLRKYNVFKASYKKNDNWEEYNIKVRQQILALTNYMTTETHTAGEKFDIESFKNLIYTIEYLDKESRERIEELYKK